MALVTNEDGTAYTHQGYFAYGRKRTGGMLPSEHNYTGQRKDASGLLYYNARYCDPQLGAFISPDTIVPQPSVLFDYNRYMYVHGNPLKYNDPSGHCRYDSDGNWQFATNCSLEEFDTLDWDSRMRWMQEFADAFSNGQYFNNILGIIEYFRDDSIFSTSDWASLSDAGVLLAIQDGQRLLGGETPMGSYDTFMNETGKGSPAVAWQGFFDSVSPDGANLSLWGKAEQLGVDYGTFVAASYATSANVAEQVQISTFVGFGNVYRTVIGTGVVNVLPTRDSSSACSGYQGVACGAMTAPSHMLHPTYSQGFVRGFSRSVINPLASIIYSQYWLPPAVPVP